MEKFISNIVFTKNRPLQLDAYLKSLFRHFSLVPIQTYIIYKPELFQEEYQQLFQKYPNCVVIRENDFHSDFLKLLNQIGTKYILFGIDDVVYFDTIDFEVIDETFNKFGKNIFGFSLRFRAENIKNDNDTISETVVARQTVYSLNWTQGRTPSTRYPFELCATIYQASLVKRVINSTINHNLITKKLFSPGSVLIKALAKAVSIRPILKSFGYFYSPNTLESWNCRWCQNHSDQLPAFLYFQKPCASAIQVNMVNVTDRKTFDSSTDYTIGTLAEKYKQGYRLDIDFVSENRPDGTHSGPKCFKLIKSK